MKVYPLQMSSTKVPFGQVSPWPSPKTGPSRGVCKFG